MNPHDAPSLRFAQAQHNDLRFISAQRIAQVRREARAKGQSIELDKDELGRVRGITRRWK